MRRPASHAGLWYSGDAEELTASIRKWLAIANASAGDAPKSARVIVAPHAAFHYSGKTAAHAFRTLDVSTVRRVLILGPSHYYNLTGCALSTYESYDTPLGPLSIDQDAYTELRSKGLFETIPLEKDDEEHSLEMHLPFVRQLFADSQNEDVKIVPILVGNLSNANNIAVSGQIVNLLESPDTAMIISTDFCHWGSRFNYKYIPPHLTSVPIHQAIRELDKEAMDAIATLDLDAYNDHIAKTRNTICGNNAVRVMLAALQPSNYAQPASIKKRGFWTFRWGNYAQSSDVRNPCESSVSYAAGCAVFTQSEIVSATVA